MKTLVILSVSLVLTITTAHGQQPEMVKDINPGSASSYIMYMNRLNNKLIFKAINHQNSNDEPWVSDGTSAGTFMLKEINPSSVTGCSMFNTAVFNNMVFFSANDGVHGSELWKTDGTPEGTVMVKDIAPGDVSSRPGHLVVFKGVLYFSAYHPDTGTELWKTEGTEASTVLVADITPDGASTNPGYLFPTENYLYFTNLTSLALYRSDGTTSGSGLLSDEVKVGQLDNPWFTEYAGNVYFRAVERETADSKGMQLWRVSGSSVERVTSIVSDEAELDPRHLIVSDNKLFFVGEEHPYGRELWVYDGTARMVKDINTSGHGNLGGFFTDYKGRLFFSAGTSSTGVELWISDGTSDGTKQVCDIWPGNISSGIVSPVIIGDTLYFTANDGTGTEIWRLISSDGQPVKFTDKPGMGADCSEMVRINHTFFFNGGDAATGTELWKMNAPGATPVSNLSANEPEIRTYPNPASDHIVIEINDASAARVQATLFNSVGTPVLSKVIDSGPYMFCLPERIKPGVYLLKVDYNGKCLIRKFLICGY